MSIWKGTITDYEYEDHQLTWGGGGGGWPRLGANYIFSRFEGGGYTAIYIGQTDDLGSRMASHEKIECIKGHRATHIHVRYNWHRDSRLHEESVLISRYHPLCNSARPAISASS